MKKNYFLWLLCILFGSTLTAQVSYSGNGNTGFGDVIGNSSLSLNDDGTTISASLSGVGSFNNSLVIYIDSKSGGHSSTSSFNDTGDALRRAISGFDGT